MSYTPTNWKAGDVVTSAKLNKMEQGIAAGGGIRVVHLTMSGLPSGGGNVRSASSSSSTAPSIQLDITPNELMDALENEEIIVIMGAYGSGICQSLISELYYDGTTYGIDLNADMPSLTSSDPDEYFTYNPSSDSSGDDGTIDGGLK